MMPRYLLSLAVLVLLMAAALRLNDLSTYPPGPHYDEAANVIITRTVAFGGARPFPMVENYQGREVLYYYLAAPLFHLIGDDRFTLQMVGVFANVLLVAATFTIARQMFPGRRGAVIGLAAAIAVTISLPQVLLSRQAFRAIILPTMQALTLTVLWRGLRSNQWPWLLAAGLLGGLSVYTYNSSRLFPLWLAIAGLTLLISSGGSRWRRLRQGVLFFGVLALATGPFALYAVQRPDIFFGRLYEVTGGSEAVTIAQSVWLHLRMFFMEGETLLRYNPVGRPYFTLAEGALLVIGLLAALIGITRRSSPLERTAYALILLSPLMVLPSVIATSGFPPNHMRSIAMVPLIFIAVGLGYERLTARLPLRWAMTGLLLGLAVGAWHTGQTYFAWAARADLFIQTDADLAAAGDWMATNSTAPVYVAAQDFNHPTLQIADTPPIRWLGTESLFVPAAEPRAVIVPRSVELPEDWQAWLSNAAQPAAGIPNAPDGQPAFSAYWLSPQMPLPPSISPANDGPPRSPYLQSAANTPHQNFPNARFDVFSAWRVLETPPQPDLMPIVHIEDTLGNVIARGETFITGSDQWEAGEILLQRVPNVRVPTGTPPGDYAIRMAWVSRGSGEYVPYLAADGSSGAVWADVGTFTVIRPPSYPPPEAMPIGVRQVSDFAAGVRLLGWEPVPEAVRPGETLPLTLHWQAIPGETRTAFAYALFLRDAAGQETPLTLAAPMWRTHPLPGWLDGQLMTERLNAALPRELPPGDYTLRLRSDPGADAIIGPLRVEGIPRVFEEPAIAARTDATFANGLRLLGANQIINRDLLVIELVWSTEAAIAEDYKVFVHLVNENGDILDQRDAMPVQNRYPTSLWAPGEFITDSYTLANAPEGVRLRVGLYDPDTGLRLRLTNDVDFVSVPLDRR